MPRPKVSVVLINWNCYPDTVECVAALKKSTYPSIEIIVVDNASTDGSADKVEKDIDGIRLLKSKVNLGWAGGSRLGTDDALTRDARYVLLLNADAFVEPDAIEKLVSRAEASSATGLVTAVIYYFKSRKMQHCGSEIDWENFVKRELKNVEEVENVPSGRFWTWATALLIKREVIEKIGFYSEEYFCYGEDLEYSVRAQRAGFKIDVAKDAQVFHRCHEIDVGGRDNLPLYFFFFMARNNLFFFRQYTKSKLRFYRKYLARIFAEVGPLHEEGKHEVVDAYLDGLYCGIKNITGRWDKTKKMPVRLKKFILSHPYLWADLLNGDFKKLIRTIVKR